MGSKTKKTIHLIIITLIILIGLAWGGKYTYSDIKDILSTLQNISAMIFTIAGIWLAYIYPSAIENIVRPSTVTPINANKETERDIERIGMIIRTIIISGLVILCIVLINVTKPIFISLSVITENHLIFMRIGVIIVIGLVYLQIIALLGVITSNVLFLNDIHAKKNEKALDKLR